MIILNSRGLRKRRTPTWVASAGVGLAMVASAVVALTALAGSASAKPWWMRGAESNEQDFLPPEVAFRVSARVDGDVVKIRWTIADGYYVYRNKIEVRAESPDLTVGQPNLPAGTRISDPYFGVQEIYEQQVEATVPFTRFDYGAHPLQIKVIYQGCAHAGLCYPPITKVLFPESGPATTPLAGAQGAPATWSLAAIAGGCGAFLLAGLLLRKGRRLPTPAP
jgi:thiol:disulfide interchange protein DsbD